jgi:hypothetical protein
LNLAHACRKSLAKSWHVDTRLNRVFASISFAAAATYFDCGGKTSGCRVDPAYPAVCFVRCWT